MKANFAFTLYSHDWVLSSIKAARNNETVEDYVKIQAKLVQHTVEEGTLTYEINEVDMHLCNDDDVFFKPDYTITEGFKFAFP